MVKRSVCACVCVKCLPLFTTHLVTDETEANWLTGCVPGHIFSFTKYHKFHSQNLVTVQSTKDIFFLLQHFPQTFILSKRCLLCTRNALKVLESLTFNSSISELNEVRFKIRCPLLENRDSVKYHQKSGRCVR